MRQKKGFVLREVCGEMAIVGEGLETIDFGKLISLNETAIWLWKKAGELGEFTTDQLADEICKEYAVERPKALSDIEKTMANWLEMGIVER